MRKKSFIYPWSKYYPKKTAFQLRNEEVPIFKWLDEAAEKNPQKISIIYNNSELSFEAFQIYSLYFANVCQKLGFNKGDRVILMLPVCREFALAFFGLLRLGVIPVPLNPKFTAKELVYYLEDLEPKMILTLDSFKKKTEKAVELSSSKAKIVIVNSNMTSLLTLNHKKIVTYEGKDDKYLYFEDFLTAQKGKISVNINPKKDIAAILYTGGTTGEPKGVMLSHYNIASYLEAQTAHFGMLLGNKKALLVLPPYHIFGLCMIISAVFRKATIVLMDKFHPENISQVIQDKKIGAFFGVPAMYAALVSHCRGKQKNNQFKCLSFCLSGGSPISYRLWNDLKEIAPNAALVEGYGLTEASGGPLMDPVVENYHKKNASVGIPIFNTEAKIIDPVTEKDLPPGTQGEIITRGTNIFQGYWRKSDLTERVLKDGWLYTKDIGIMDKDGIFFIEGRMDDMIDIRGEKVWPREVEKILENHKKVKEVAVVGIKDDDNDGEIIKAYVVLKDGQEATEEELIDFCKDKLVYFKIPKTISFCQQLPKSHMGKILHYKLREKSISERK